jgi:hypothetical protein
METMSLLEEHLTYGDDYFTRRPSIEEGHTKACLASSMIAAIENWRDAEGVTDHDFRLMAQDNTFLETADDYLNVSQLSDCKCPERRAEESHTWTVTCLYRGGINPRTERYSTFGTLTEAVLQVTDLLHDPHYSSACIGRSIYELGGTSAAISWFWMSTGYGEDTGLL